VRSVKAVVSGLCNHHTREIDGPRSGRYRDLGAINYLWRPTTTCIVAAISTVIDLCRHAATLILASGSGDLDDVLVRGAAKRQTQHATIFAWRLRRQLQPIGALFELQFG